MRVASDKPVELKQKVQSSPVAGQKWPSVIQHGEELNQPGHSKNSAPPTHTTF